MVSCAEALSSNQLLSPVTMTRGSSGLELAMTACHGMHRVFSGLAERWSALGAGCANGSIACGEHWRAALQPRASLLRVGSASGLDRAGLLEAARCALAEEYQIDVQEEEIQPPPPLHQRKHRRPTLVGLYMRKILANSAGSPFAAACQLSDSALALGWDVVLGVGIWRGLLHKFTWVLSLLEHVDQSGLVVFLDVSDTLIQQTPEAVADAFASQPYDFVWSAERNCFPLQDWPYNLGLGGAVCAAFGKASGQRKGYYVNSGGWMATVGAAREALTELTAAISRDLRRGELCGKAGTDQYYANTQYLRRRGRADSTSQGLDSDGVVFLTWGERHQPARKLKLFLNQSVGECIPRAAHCFHSNHSQWQQHEWQHGERRPRSQRRICPAFLHFPGGQKSHISGVRRALDAGRGACRAKGSLTVVNVQTGHLQMRRGTSAQRCDPEWVGKVVEERWVASLAKSLLTVGLT